MDDSKEFNWDYSDEFEFMYELVWLLNLGLTSLRKRFLDSLQDQS